MWQKDHGGQIVEGCSGISEIGGAAGYGSGVKGFHKLYPGYVLPR